MKQVFLSGKGDISVFDVPLPGRLPNSLLVRNEYSLISTGTESGAVSKRRGWIGALEKASQSSDRVGKVWQLARTQGWKRTWEIVRSKLDDWTQIGYSSCGTVIETDGESMEFVAGDRVACMGTGLANHAEYVVIPSNMAVKLHSSAQPDEAAFGAIACVAQQGIRVLDLRAGENIVVVGLGLVGMLTAILGRAMGYNVFGVDLSQSRVNFCKHHYGLPGCTVTGDVVTAVRHATGGVGADGVVLTAATKSSDPTNLAFDLCRQRGSVAVVGNVGLDLKREKMYRKEISLKLSCSYGPGRYDDNYELGGQDYPIGYVRWPERRNLQYFAQLLEQQRIDLRPLISRTYDIDSAADAYAATKQRDSNAFGVLFDYGVSNAVATPMPPEAYVLRTSPTNLAVSESQIPIGVIGCGSFAKNVHLPNLSHLASQFRIAGVASRSGTTAALAARKFKIPVATSDHRVLLDDPRIKAVLVCTRHSSHARMVMDALSAGKHVFVEKPLCLTAEEGQRIESLANKRGLVVRVGFNRRFAPYLQTLKTLVGPSGQRTLACRVNVASSQVTHWSNTAKEGGRFLGEGVHFLDLCNWFVNQAPATVSAHYLGEPSPTNPNLCVTLGYPDGSLGSVTYITCGHAGIGKESFECHGNGRSGRCIDFRDLEGFGTSVTRPRRGRGDKGHIGQLHEFYQSMRGEPATVAGADAWAGTIATRMVIAALESARSRSVVAIDPTRCDRQGAPADRDAA